LLKSSDRVATIHTDHSINTDLNEDGIPDLIQNATRENCYALLPVKSFDLITADEVRNALYELSEIPKEKLFAVKTSSDDFAKVEMISEENGFQLKYSVIKSKEDEMREFLETLR